MSIFVEKPIEQDSIYVRFYKWKDSNKGYGDAGTHKYMELPIEDFEMEERERFDGSNYYVYELKKERGIELFHNHWWMSYGYEKSTRSSKNNEIRELQEKMNKLKNISK